MKADFEKGIKVCSKCRRELPLNMFYKANDKNDGLFIYCKNCYKKYFGKRQSTFNRKWHKRGRTNVYKRDYELTNEELEIRNKNRKKKSINKNNSQQGILVWYDGKLDNLMVEEYRRILKREYSRQKMCAIRGYLGRTKPSEHFLFDFDLKQMLKDNVYIPGKDRKYITKWWKGEIRHWTVNDGIWKE